MNPLIPEHTINENGFVTTEDGDWYEDMDEFLAATIGATEEDIRFMIKGREILDNKARAYFWERFDSDPEWGESWNGSWVYRPSIDSIDIGETEIEVECSAPACKRGCCGTDRRTYSFPTSYLWLDQTAILAEVFSH